MLFIPFGEPAIKHAMLRDAAHFYRVNHAPWTANACLKLHDEMYGTTEKCEFCQEAVLETIEEIHKVDGDKLFDEQDQPVGSYTTYYNGTPILNTPMGTFVPLNILPKDVRDEIIRKANGG